MALLSSSTLIKCLSMFHLTLAYYMLTAPRIIAQQNLVWILGEAMGLPQSAAFTRPSPPLAFAALLFACIGISDFTAASMHEQIALEYFGAQAPVRLFFLFSVSTYAYLFKKGGFLGGKGVSYRPSAVGEDIKNSVVFAWGFVEIMMWFWIYVNLKEERKELAKKILAKEERERELAL